MIAELFREIHRRNRVLSTVGWIHLVLLGLAIGLSLIDHRLIMGINAWVKPMKFMASIAIYLWTLAWFVRYLPPGKSVDLIAWGTSLSMLVETACLWLQAARGTHSHFNVSTPFDTVVFGVMGIMILLNSLLVAVLLFLFFRNDVRLPPVYLWALRLGIAVFLIGSLEGTLMIQNGAHSVGIADGGPGLPFVNWSTEAGDLRITHFLGLHALQIIPLFGYLLSRLKRRKTVSRFQPLFLGAFVLLYLGSMLFTLLRAVQGKPLPFG